MLSLGEKVAIQGVESLADEELLALLIDDLTDAENVAHNILAQHGASLSRLYALDLSRLRMCEGLGLKKALRIQAAFEMGRRANIDAATLRYIKSSDDVEAVFRRRMEALNHEECWVLYLNDSGAIVGEYRESHGGINSTVVDVRLIIRRALDLLSTQLVLVHNHPSGTSQPSQQDVEMTQNLRAAAALFDISLLDHLIFAPSSEPFSMRAADWKPNIFD